MANIKVLKLVTGEEVLTELLENGDKLTMRNATRIVVMPNKIDPQQPNVGLAPWAQFSDDKDISIDRSHVIAIMEPIKEFKTQYQAAFSGLALPQSKLIIPGSK